MGDAAGRMDMAEAGPVGEVPARTVVRDSAGIVIGDHAVQANAHYTVASPYEDYQLDAVSLAALSPHAAAVHVRQMRHDRAAILLASASPKRVVPVLRVLLRADEPLLVALLADVNPERAAELVAPLASDAPWLEHLPAAVEAIAHEALKYKLTDEGPPGKLQRVRSSTDAEGYVRHYPITTSDDAWICWRPGSKPILVVPPLTDCYMAAGGPAGPLGLPLGSLCVGRSSFDTHGTFQRFECGRIYRSGDDIHVVLGAISGAYQAADAAAGYLGFPVSDCQQIETGLVQHFQGGRIYETEPGAAIPVRASMVDDFLRDWEFAPVSEEEDAPASPFGTAARMQRIRAGDGDTSCVYHSGRYGMHSIAPEIYPCYVGMGASASWLGFPMGPPEHRKLDDLLHQPFEGGGIYMPPRQQPEAASEEIYALITGTPDLLTRLGRPLSGQVAAGADGADRIHYFENGVITRRNGEAAAWFRS